MGLTPFEGRDVLATPIRIVNSGAGLSASLVVSPVELDIDEPVYILIEGSVSKIQFRSIKDTDALERVQTIKAGTATFVSEDFARETLDETKRRIEEHKGISRLPGIDEEVEAVHEALTGDDDDEGFYDPEVAEA